MSSSSGVEGLDHYRVGGQFADSRRTWPEGTQLWLEKGVSRLALFLRRPHPVEIEAINEGEGRFAWVERQFTGFLLFKFEPMQYSDAAYAPHRLSLPFSLEEFERGEHHVVVTFLVDADTGVIRALRAFTWPAYFVNTIVKSVRRLAARPYVEAAARAEHEGLYAMYPDGRAMAKLVHNEAAATCKGGQREDRRV